MTLKLPKEKCDELIQNIDGFESFSPLDRKMKEGVHITKDDPEGFEEETNLILHSVNFVREMARK